MIAARLFVLSLLAPVLTAQSGMVEGRVVSTAGDQGVRKALVVLRGRTETYPATTDANGVFRMVGVVPGEYTLGAERQGWVREEGTQSPILTVRPGQSLTGVLFRLVPTGVIAGRILDSDGDPVSRAMVEAMQFAWQRGRKMLRAVQTTVANDRGQYRLYGLRPGRYYVRTWRAATFSAAVIPFFYPSTAMLARAVELELPPGAELGPLEIRTAQLPTYSIRFPAPSAQKPEDFVKNMVIPLVLPVGIDQNPTGAAIAALRGPDSYQMRNLAPRRYVVTVQTRDPERPDNMLAFRQYVDIVDHDVDVAFSLRPTMEIPGRIEGPSVNVARVELLAAEGQPSAGAPAVPVNRSFTFRGIVGDIYDFRIATSGDGYLKSLRFEDRELPTQQVDLTGAPGRLTVTLGNDGGEITGLAVNEEGKPFPRASIAVAPVRAGWPDLVRTATADENGNFRLQNIAPGDCRLFAWESTPPGASEDPDFRAPFLAKSLAVKVAPDSEQQITVTVAKPAN